MTPFNMDVGLFARAPLPVYWHSQGGGHDGSNIGVVTILHTIWSSFLSLPVYSFSFFLSFFQETHARTQKAHKFCSRKEKESVLQPLPSPPPSSSSNKQLSREMNARTTVVAAASPSSLPPPRLQIQKRSQFPSRLRSLSPLSRGRFVASCHFFHSSVGVVALFFFSSFSPLESGS